MIWLLAFLFAFLYISGLFTFRAFVKYYDATDKDDKIVLAFWFVWVWLAIYEIIRDKQKFEW
ncbi:hypothetical protein GNY05_00012 [Escherichia phage vB_EcoS_XY3]|uniref:Uncharacterized protein n=1 Tax=Escherichia phage vB_EcoS_XY3 TaxID=2681376 RepID=A0A6B9LWK1_9CAUD|nr:hypothetical protein GNY05_00012 [Escherichia phage vB_EcoS_XY3]